MKLYTKKANRGIILAGVLFIGMGIYIGIDTANFKNSKNELSDSAKQYISDMAQSNISTDGNTKENWTKLVEDNWKQNDYFENDNVGWYNTKNDYLADIKINGGQNLAQKGSYVSNCTAKAESTSVSKAGPNLAVVDVTYTLDIEYYGLPNIFSTTTINCIGNAIDVYETGDITKKQTTTAEGYTQIYFQQVDSEWKIVAISDNGLMFDTLYDEDMNDVNIAGGDIVE